MKFNRRQQSLPAGDEVTLRTAFGASESSRQSESFRANLLSSMARTHAAHQSTTPHTALPLSPSDLASTDAERVQIGDGVTVSHIEAIAPEDAHEVVDELRAIVARDSARQR